MRVDKHILPTASIASAKRHLGYPNDEVSKLIRWMKKGDYESSFAARAQAQLWFPNVEIPVDSAPASELDRMYQWLRDLSDKAKHDEALSNLIALLSDEVHDNRKLTRKAIVLASFIDMDDEEGIRRASGVSKELQVDLAQAMSSDFPPLEAVCLITAFLVHLYFVQELTAGSGAPFQLQFESRTSSSQDLMQRVKTLDKKIETIRRESDKARNFATRVIYFSIAFAVAALAWPLFELYVTFGSNATILVAITAAVLGGTGALLRYVYRLARRVGIDVPPLKFLSELRESDIVD